MAETTARTLVCSVMFLDIFEYSKRSLDDQQRIKQMFNEILSRGLEAVPPRDFIVLDTGDGAAIAFLGDPEDALFVGIAVRNYIASLPPELLAVRMGINLGPVKLVWDINAQMNIVGDGINAAQRVMSFAQPGQLLVSRPFYEVVSRLPGDYANLFSILGTRTDKHVREHEVYSLAESARLERSGAGERRRVSRPEAAPPPGGQERRVREPAKIFDAGARLIVSAANRDAVEEALARLAGIGARILSDVAQVGNKWMASCTHPQVPSEACKVEEAGLKRIVTGPTREAVDEKVRELAKYGAKLVSDIEFHDGAWTAVCDIAGR